MDSPHLSDPARLKPAGVVSYGWGVSLEIALSAVVDGVQRSRETVQSREFGSYSEATDWAAARTAPCGCRYEVYLWRKSSYSTSFARMYDGRLPGSLVDSCNMVAAAVPMRFHDEVRAARARPIAAHAA